MMDVAVYISKTEVTAGVAKSEAFVIKTHKVQDGGVKVMDVHDILYGLEAELVGGAVGHAAANATAGKPHSEAVMIVVATINLAGITTGFGQLNSGCAAKLAAPHHECVFKKTARFQIREKCADCLITLTRKGAMP